MAGPITWRNVTGPSVADASRPLDSARLALTDGFDRLGKTLQNYEAGETRIAERVDDGRVQAFMDRLQRVKSTDEMAQLEASGELDTMRQGMSAKSLGLIRGASEARLGNVMEGVTKTNAFNDAALARERAPLINQAKMLAASGNIEGLNAFLKQHDLGDESTYVTSGLTAQEAQAARGRSAAAEGRAATMAPLEQARVEAATASSIQSTAASQAQVAQSAEDAGYRNLDRLDKAVNETSAALGAKAKGIIGTPEGMSSLLAGIGSTIKDPKALEDAVTFVNKALTSNPAFSQLPTNVIQSIVLKRANDFGKTFGSWDGTLVNGMADDMKQALADNAGSMTETQRLRDGLSTKLQAQRQLLEEAQGKLSPTLAAANAQGSADPWGGAYDNPVPGVPDYETDGSEPAERPAKGTPSAAAKTAEARPERKPKESSLDYYLRVEEWRKSDEIFKEKEAIEELKSKNSAREAERLRLLAQRPDLQRMLNQRMANNQ